MSIAADRIRTGEADIMIAAGTESMSMIPMLGRLAINADVFAKDENLGIAYGMGLTAEKVAAGWKVSRDEQDAFALAQPSEGACSAGGGRVRAEISAYPIRENVPDLASGKVVTRDRSFERDEGPRADASADGLAKLKPVFAAKGSVTAGNSSQMSDGAGASILVSEQSAEGTESVAAGALGRLCGRRRAAGGDGRRADRGDPQGSQEHRPVTGPDRLDRAQRSLRGAESCGHEGAQARPGEGESAGRRNRAWPSAGRDRRGAHGDDRAWLETAQAEVRDGHDVHRDRHGRCRHFRSLVNDGSKGVAMNRMVK